MEKEKREHSRFKKVAPLIKLGVTCLMELFTEGVCTSVMSNVNGNRLAKYGARLGAGILGLYLGDKAADYLIDEADEMMDDIEEFKEAIEEAKEE